MTRRRYTGPDPTLVAIVVGVLFVIGAAQQFFTRNPSAGDKIQTLLWILLGTIIATAISAVVAVAVGVWKRIGMVTPKPDGRVPVALKTLKATGHDITSLSNLQRTELARAQRIIPEGVHTVTSHIPTAPTVDLLADDPEPARLMAPKLSALLSEGLIRPGRFYIGWDGAKHVFGTWEDFCTIGAGGTMGTGKSNTGAFYLAQVLAVGGLGYVADPNAGHSQSLANRLGRMTELLAAPVAKSEEEILRLVKQFASLLEERIATDDEGDVPAILLVDEFTAIMLDDELAKHLPKLLARINAQGRKYGVFVFLLAQLWGAEMTGGTKVRNLLAGRVCHNLPGQEARNLLGLPAAAMPKDLHELQRGEAYVRTLTGNLFRVKIPEVDAQGVSDLRKQVAAGGGKVIAQPIAEGLPGDFPGASLRVIPGGSAIPGQSAGNQRATTSAIGPELAKFAEMTDLEPEHLRRIILAHLRTKSIPETIKALYEPAKNGGNPYTRGLAAVTEVIREGLQRDETGEGE